MSLSDWRIWVMAVLAAGMAAYWVLREAAVPAEERVRQAHVGLAEAIMERDAAKIMSFIAVDYADSSGYDRRAIHQLALGARQQTQRIDVVLNDLRIQVNDHVAHSQVDAMVEYLAAGERVRREGRVVMVWKRYGRRWKLQRAEGWSRFPDME